MELISTIEKPLNLSDEFYFTYYINLAEGSHLLLSLEKSRQEFIRCVDLVKNMDVNYKYAEGKWSIKQLLQHITDTERILSYRALRFSRNDFTELQSYDEDFFADNDNSLNLDISQILYEFNSVRSATIEFYKNIDPSKLDNLGPSNGLETSPRMLGWINSGHCLHHLNVLKERYL